MNFWRKKRSEVWVTKLKNQMAVKKPRFAVLLEDLHNATDGKLVTISYGLADDKDPSMNGWVGTFFLSNGAKSVRFSLVCGQKYPDEVPVLTFEDNVQVTDKIRLDQNRRVVEINILDV